MVEIIKRGKRPIERVHDVTCRHCKSQLRFTEKEATRTSDQRMGDFLSITCPVCERTVTTEYRYD